MTLGNTPRDLHAHTTVNHRQIAGSDFFARPLTEAIEHWVLRVLDGLTSRVIFGGFNGISTSTVLPKRATTSAQMEFSTSIHAADDGCFRDNQPSNPSAKPASGTLKETSLEDSTRDNALQRSSCPHMTTLTRHAGEMSEPDARWSFNSCPFQTGLTFHPHDVTYGLKGA